MSPWRRRGGTVDFSPSAMSRTGLAPERAKENDTMGEDRHDWPRLTLPTLAAAALLVFLAGSLARHVALTLPFPYPVEYGEGVTANWLLRARQGLSLYPAMTDASLPWLHNPYGPLWFWLARWLPEAGASVFMAARLASLLGFLACLLILWRLARRDVPPLAACGICALLGASPLAWRQATLARVDMLGLAFALGAVWAMEMAGRRGRAGAGREPSAQGRTAIASTLADAGPWALAGTLAAAAILVKPLFLAAAGAGLAAGCLRGWRQGLAFILGLALPLAVAAGWLLADGENAVLAHLGAMNRIGLSLPLMARLAAAAAGRHPLAFALLAYGLATGDRRSPRWWLALLTVALLPASAKIGADAHYHLPTVLAGTLLAGPVLANLAGQRHHGLLPWCLVAQFALYLPLAPRPVYTATYGQEIPAGQSALTPGEADREIGRLLAGEMAGGTDPILADDPGYLLAAGRTIQVQPFQYGWLVRRGRVDPGPLAARIARRQFSLIVLRSPRPGGPGPSDLPAAIQRAVGENYALHREIGPYRVFLPGDPPLRAESLPDSQIHPRRLHSQGNKQPGRLVSWRCRVPNREGLP